MNKEKIPGVVIGKLMHLGGMIERHSNKMLRPFNLNHQQFAVFFEIAKKGRVKQKEMVNRLLLEKAHVSKIVKKLQEMELLNIEKDEKDKRSFWLSLTKKGDDVLDQCSKMFAQWNMDWIMEIDENEFSSILDNLTKLQKVFMEKTK